MTATGSRRALPCSFSEQPGAIRPCRPSRSGRVQALALRNNGNQAQRNAIAPARSSAAETGDQDRPAKAVDQPRGVVEDLPGLAIGDPRLALMPPPAWPPDPLYWPRSDLDVPLAWFFR